MFRYGHGRVTPLRQDDTIRKWPIPTTKRQLQAFLGTTNTLRDHIWRYAKIASPLYEATGIQWKWTDKQHYAFTALKQAAARIIDHHEHDPLQAATITTDASLFGIAAYLSQNGRITGICSRALTPAEKNYDTMDRELLAIVYAIEKWITLLEVAPEIRVRTDHKNLEKELKPTIINRRRNRYITFLSQFRIKWMYIEGAKNPADSPSRRPDYSDPRV